MSDSPRRRWYQFSLRKFFVVVTMACAVFGYWVHWSREWIRQRHAWMDAHPDSCSTHTLDAPMPHAPFGLWLFGEEGVQVILADFDEWPLAHRLFPEVKVMGRMPPHLLDQGLRE